MSLTRDLNHLIKLSDAGDLKATMELANLFADKSSVHFNIGYAAYFYLQIGNANPEAGKALQKLTVDYPKNGEIFFYYASYLLNINNKELAYQNFEKSAQLKFSLAFISLANRYIAGDNVVKEDLKEAANYLLKAAKHATPDTLKVKNPVSLLGELALLPTTHDQVFVNLVLCYQKGICVEKSVEFEIYYLRLRANNIFLAVMQNRMHIDTNLYSILGVLSQIYKEMLLKHLDLLRKQQPPTQAVSALIVILQTLHSISIERLIQQEKLPQTLQELNLPAGKDLLNFLGQYKIITAGIHAIEERTKTYLLALKEDLKIRKFLVASVWDNTKFVPGTPGGVSAIIDILKNMNEQSSAADVRKAALQIRDKIGERDPKKKRDDGTILFYNDCLQQLKCCWLFTPVDQVITAYTEQRALASSLPQPVPCDRLLSPTELNTPVNFVLGGTPNSPTDVAPLVMHAPNAALPSISTSGFSQFQPAVSTAVRQPQTVAKPASPK